MNDYVLLEDTTGKRRYSRGLENLEYSIRDGILKHLSIEMYMRSMIIKERNDDNKIIELRAPTNIHDINIDNDRKYDRGNRHHSRKEDLGTPQLTDVVSKLLNPKVENRSRIFANKMVFTIQNDRNIDILDKSKIFALMLWRKKRFRSSMWTSLILRKKWMQIGMIICLKMFYLL